MGSIRLQWLQMCTFVFSLSLFLLIFISLFSCLSLSLFMSVSLSFFSVCLSLLNAHCCVLLCVVVCVVVWLCVLLWWWLWMWLCVCVSSCLALKNAPVCTFKKLPCVRSERPRHSGHGRFEGTHGSVSPSLLVSLSSHTSLSSRVSLSLSSLMCLSPLTSLSFSLSFHLTFFLFSLSITLFQ